MPNNAVVHMEAAPIDTTSWQIVSGVFVPDSAYTVVYLGNFFSDSLIAPQLLVDDAGVPSAAYVYIDDVCVSQVEGVCDVGNAIFTTDAERVLVSPNPNSGSFNVKLASRQTPPSIRVFDVVGTPVRASVVQLTPTTWRIDMLDVDDGVYVIGLMEGPAYTTRRVVVATL